MAAYTVPQPDAITIRLLAYEPPAPDALQIYLGAGASHVHVSITDGGKPTVASIAARLAVVGSLTESGVASVGYGTNHNTLNGAIITAGVASVDALAGATQLRAILAESGMAGTDQVAASAAWPLRSARLANGGADSTGSITADVHVSASLIDDDDVSDDVIVTVAPIRTALIESGQFSHGAATLYLRSHRTAVIVDRGVLSRSGTPGSPGSGGSGGAGSVVIVGSTVGPDVPPELVIEEKHGRVLSDDSAELTYIIRHTHDDAVARQAVLNFSPWSWRGKAREDAEVEEIGYQLWLGTVRYSAHQTQRQNNQSRFSFETRGGTQHITQSLETVGQYGSQGAQPPDFGGAIGVQSHGVEGADITVPVYTFTEVHYFDQVTIGYKSTLFYLTGRVNDAPFKGLAAGECLFLGAAGAKRGATGTGDPWEITFAFAGSPNVGNLSISDITGIVKLGWDYLWVRYAEAEDSSAKMLIHKPIAAYVEKVYRQGSFAQLGIGA